MAIEVITREDLNEFRSLLLNDLKEIIQSKPQQTKQWLKSNEVRKLLNISPGTLQNLRINGTLTYTKVGGIMYYDNSDIDKLLNGNKVASGNGISGGQKQRILIARAVYKNPHYIFFDEATSALDAENEKIIHDNLQEFFIGKTVIIIAHRLSTVKNADNIIVLKNGKIVEQGTHKELVEMKNEYFNLVKNQLELGN